MTRYLITGGAGFIGSHLVDLLVDTGNSVLVLDDESADGHEQFYWNSRAWNYKVDICDYTIIKSLFKDVDVVFHLAAESRIQPSILNPIKAVQVNVLGTCNVLQAAREYGVKRVIYSSTSAAYGLSNRPPLIETMPRDWLNPYSISKCSGEDLCVLYTKLYGLETVIFRYFNVYGDRSPTSGQYSLVVGRFLKQLADNQPLTVVGTGKRLRDFVHVDDVVRANILAADLNNKSVVGETINIGTGKVYSVMDLVKMLRSPFVYVPDRAGEANITQADITKAQNLLGWQPKIDLKEWIERKIQV